jgi:hypothetical protein
LIQEEIKTQLPEFRISLDRYTQKIKIDYLKDLEWKPVWTPLWDLLGFKNHTYSFGKTFISHKTFKFTNSLFYLSCSHLNDFYDENEDLFCVSIFEKQIEQKKITFSKPKDIKSWDWSLFLGKCNYPLEFEDGKESKIVLEIEFCV